MLDHDRLQRLTMGDFAAPCEVFPWSTSAMDVDGLFDREPGRHSVVVRDRAGRCALIARGDFYQRLTGRLGYGYSLHRHRPLLDMELMPAPTFPASASVVAAGLELIQRGSIAHSPVLLVELGGDAMATISTQEVLAHLARTFHRKVDALESSDRRFRSMLANANEVIFLVGREGNIQWVSETVQAVMGREPSGLLGEHIAQWVTTEDKPRVQSMLDEVLGGPRRHVAGDATTINGQGERRTVEFHATDLLDDPAVAAIVVNIRDVTERRILEGRLRHDARHDSLTGLPNRAMFSETLERHLAEASGAVAIAFLDLDGFKEVNDTLGHASGDAVLKAVAAAVRDVVRGDDLVARLGGDEFALLMCDDGGPTPLPQVVGRVVERVLEAINRPLAVAGERIIPGASIGVAFADESTEAEQLLQRADVAMYQAKASGRNRASWWDLGMHESVMERHRMSRQLDVAVRDGHLRLLYQPLVELPDGRTSGYEALLRWERPGHGTMAPGSFIAVAEETKVIVGIGRWVLMQACCDMATCDPAPDGLTVSVNLSARQLETDDITLHIREALDRSGLSPHRLEVEVTETAMMQRLDLVVPRIQAMRDLGVRVAIDDFGVGYSSLAQLRGLPVDCIKIDRSFVSALGSSRADRELVTGIVGLARALRLSIVAEGVETAEQAAAVTALGCDRAQGFFYSEPVPAQQIATSIPGRDRIGEAVGI